MGFIVQIGSLVLVSLYFIFECTLVVLFAVTLILNVCWSIAQKPAGELRMSECDWRSNRTLL